MCALKRFALAGLLLLALEPSQGVAGSDDLATRSADYAAVERVYYDHRLGNKLPFEKVLPAAALEKMVAVERKKEAALKRAYGIEITAAQIEAEVKRIDSTSRAPEMLAEIKAALGNDSARFARAVARPILVERELRARFENDDKLHAAGRHEAEQLREKLLAASGLDERLGVLKQTKAGAMNETTWQLTPRPEAEKSQIRIQKSETAAPLSIVPTSPRTSRKASNLNSQPSTSSSGSYSVEATAQSAEELTPPTGERDRKFYFDDLDPELQKVLRVQLQKPADVSAVIETPGGFLLYLAKEKTAETLSVATLSIPKRSYEEWLNEQKENNP